jgi:hypothetical protein
MPELPASAGGTGGCAYSGNFGVVTTGNGTVLGAQAASVAITKTRASR